VTKEFNGANKFCFCGIIYCRTIKVVETWATLLGGVAYHGKLSYKKRIEIEKSWAKGEVRVCGPYI